MSSAGIGLCVLFSAGLVAGDAPAAAPPRTIDRRLVLERIAAEPEIVTPTGIAVDRRGRVLVIESHTHFRPEDYKGPTADRIKVFEDRDRDGRPECVGTFFEGTRMTMSVAVADDGSVFVATRSALYRLADHDGDGRADATDGGRIPAPIVRLDTPGDYPHNGLSGFAFDIQGTVYFGLGENLGAEYRLKGSDGTTLSGGGEGGNIYKCHPDGTELERVATGFWNPFHMAFDVVGQLFAVDNDPDSRPPCRLLHIVEGGDYGYRFRNGRKGLHPFTAWNGELPGTLGMVAGTGEAPSGIVAYHADNLPGDYRGTLLVTSWGDHRIEQYRLEPRGASFEARMLPVVTGGEDFRPVGIAVAPDGSLYFSDWVDKSYTLHGKGRVWRLRCVKSMHGNSNDPRMSQRDVDIAGGESFIAHLRAAGGDASARELGGEIRNPSAAVRALTIRTLPASRLDLKGLAASDDSPLVRAEAMRRLCDPSAKDLLLGALATDDPFVRQAARQGLRRSLALGDLVALAGSKGLAPAQRLGLILILRDLDRPECRALVPSLLSDADPAIKFAAIQWIGEHRLASFRPQLLAELASRSVTRGQFEATLAALEQLDRPRADPRDEVAGEDYVAALLQKPHASPAVVERALRILRPDHPVLGLGLLKRFLVSPYEPIRVEAALTLGQSLLPERFGVLAQTAGDDAVSNAVRAYAIVGMADDASRQRGRLMSFATGAERVLRHEALRSLRGIAITDEELGKLRAASEDDLPSIELVDRLREPKTATATATAADPDRSPAAIDAWIARLAGPADPSAGERVFFHSKGPGCYRCHQVDGRGGRAGPELSTLTATGDRRRLVESIVAPSKEIAPQFVAWSVARTDGTVFTGILLEQSPDGSLVFADAQAHRITIAQVEIAQRKPQTTSIMPEDLVQSMTSQEFRDLVAFLSQRP
jgi:putative membrane-bound dehydrogenase-like protein